MACIKGQGILNVTIGNRTYPLDSEGDVSIYPSDQKREERNNGEFVISDTSPYIEGVFRIPPDVAVRDLQELECTSVTVVLRNGRVFHLRMASQVAEEAFNAKEGTLSMRFIGESCEEVVPASG